MFHTWLTHGLAGFYTYLPGVIVIRPKLLLFVPVFWPARHQKLAITYNTGYSLLVLDHSVPGLVKALSIFRKPVFFDGTFVLLIVADEASLNAKREERLERHFFISDH